MNKSKSRNETKGSTDDKIKEISAMAFYHQDGLVPAWNFASKFAGEGGRIATLPDVINARLATESGSIAWEKYITTSTAEYLGRRRNGSMAIIVAHGIGPMSTLDGILKAYGHEFKDKSRNNHGGRISQEEFWKLEDGKYGKVVIIDLQELLDNYKYPFLEILSKAAALAEPLLNARLGLNAHKYIRKHAEIARKWQKENDHDAPFSGPGTIEMGDASNCSYQHFPLKENMAYAHLITIGGLKNLGYYEHGEHRRSLVSDVSCHEWSNGVRFVGISADKEITSIHPGFENISNLISQNWTKLMEPASQVLPIGIRSLIKVGDETWFTQYPKIGSAMDTCEPEFQVISIKLIDKPIDFTTEICGYHMFFRYNVKEVETIKPFNANAYYLAGEPEIIYSGGNPKYHQIKIQFCHIETDTTKRLIRDKQLRNNFDTLMKLVI